ncbi:hypothetical protein R0131_07825 [Clostridium sp. AL.422]|uniref:hypothetical protein n=1 Tax=Clostridium TaxID=1485 RepID=UPI00293DB009|nr:MULTISPECIES: hypothetical protein [unclassified Clostridium]MDV4150744.1 hypothetical protein [Clostridium sp. AL.422]
MKSRSWRKYIIYLILIVGLYITGTLLLEMHYDRAAITFMYNYWLITLIRIIFYGGIGVVLGLDGFLIELKREGKWKFNIPKLIILGIPSLIFSIPYIVILVPISNSFSNIFTISSIILGYTLISSLYKEVEDEKQ